MSIFGFLKKKKRRKRKENIHSSSQRVQEQNRAVKRIFMWTGFISWSGKKMRWMKVIWVHGATVMCVCEWCTGCMHSHTSNPPSPSPYRPVVLPALTTQTVSAITASGLSLVVSTTFTIVFHWCIYNSLLTACACTFGPLMASVKWLSCWFRDVVWPVCSAFKRPSPGG